MRKIEKAMCEAIGQKRNMWVDNTRVEYHNDAHGETAEVYLWGNHLGTFVYKQTKFYVNGETYAKWPTRTTKSRLRALGASLV
ncbi:hypothetical protein UFOVP729_10 [uncultured Caudovirales phage]|uniref:Uncharacterized protein n=1 Tax=uncultured Caudovirales phage TaxID=2100421 RepID=A0A6J5NPM7_9CAUD|nr:hypothetical protein UFOVP729_10 [uncultured Caudovirales phage]